MSKKLVVIDLKDLAAEAIQIRDRAGKVWTLDPNLTGMESLMFIRQAGKGGLDAFEGLEQIYALIACCLKQHHPEMTAEKAKSVFGFTDVVLIMQRIFELNRPAHAESN